MLSKKIFSPYIQRHRRLIVVKVFFFFTVRLSYLTDIVALNFILTIEFYFVS